jgi:hypothetical protein
VIHLKPDATASRSTSRPLPAELPSDPDSRHSLTTDPLPGAAPSCIEAATEDADLIITSLHPQHSSPCASDHLTLLAARLLRKGGILAVLTHSDWSSGELTDPTGPLVASAQNADLLYLQHIVALHIPVRCGQLQDATTVAQTPQAHGRGMAAPHHRISSDVLVFAQPRDHKPPLTFATAAKTELMQ